MKTITTIEEVLAVVDPETVLLDSKCRSYQWSLTMGGEEGATRCAGGREGHVRATPPSRRGARSLPEWKGGPRPGTG